MSEVKYRKGGRITSLDELAAQEFVYLGHKITHRGWFMSWQFRYAKMAIANGWVFRADRRTDDG